MVALKLSTFGGMIPAVDPYLLPDNQAALSENAWVYSGTLEGLRESVSVHTLANPLARKAFRIPEQYYDKDHIPDSYWLEFTEQDVDVVVSPIASDQYDRFYWAGQGTPPQYNTKARIIAGSPAFKLGIPAPTVAPLISRASGKYYFEAGPATFRYTGGAASMYYSRGFAVDPNSLTGEIDTIAYEDFGATRAISSINGNVDKSGTPAPALTAPNAYVMQGNRAELRYGTTNDGLRVTIDDAGRITVGIPSTPNPATSTEPYKGLGIQETRAYVYTWVSAYGEEGPPSPPTVYTGWSEDPWVIKLTSPDGSVTTGRNITKARIYRTVTAAGGETTYFLVTELDLATTTFTDDITNDVVVDNAILESTFWAPPPDDLKGMISLPNGIVAGWTGNEVWFCEPYRPHAWPAPYSVSVEFPIVGLGVIGQTLIVCTSGSPYAISGVNPANMAVSRIAVYEPCLSRGSIVSTPTGVAYASPNGLAVAVPGQVQVVTRNVISKDLWLDPQDFLNVPTLRASILNGAYYCWGSVAVGCFEQTAFDNDSFLQGDFTGAYNGAIIDVGNPRVSWNNLRSVAPMYNCYTDTWTGEVMTIRDGQVWWLDLGKTRTHGAYRYRTKIFEMPNKRNLEAMRIWFDTFPDTPELNPVRNTSQNQTLAPDQYGLVRVYAEGRLVLTREIRIDGEFMRLPSGFKAQFWQIEFEARVRITQIELATAAKELGNA